MLSKYYCLFRLLLSSRDLGPRMTHLVLFVGAQPSQEGGPPRLRPLAVCWTPAGEIYVGCEPRHLLLADPDAASVRVLFDPTGTPGRTSTVLYVRWAGKPSGVFGVETMTAPWKYGFFWMETWARVVMVSKDPGMFIHPANQCGRSGEYHSSLWRNHINAWFICCCCGCCCGFSSRCKPCAQRWRLPEPGSAPRWTVCCREGKENCLVRYVNLYGHRTGGVQRPQN